MPAQGESEWSQKTNYTTNTMCNGDPESSPNCPEPGISLESTKGSLPGSRDYEIESAHMQTNLLSELIQASHKYFSRAPGESELESEDDLNTMNHLLAQIRPWHLPLHEPIHAIEYYDIYGTDKFSICVFALRKGESMPIHDHPEMTVFSRVVSGNLAVRMYEILDETKVDNSEEHYVSSSSQSSTSSSQLKAQRPQSQRLTQPITSQHASQLAKNLQRPIFTARVCLSEVINGDTHAVTPSFVPTTYVPHPGIVLIRSDSSVNLHAFHAESDHAVVLDILGPPYDTARNIRFFRQVPFRESSSIPSSYSAHSLSQQNSAVAKTSAEDSSRTIKTMPFSLGDPSTEHNDNLSDFLTNKAGDIVYLVEDGELGEYDCVERVWQPEWSEWQYSPNQM